MTAFTADWLALREPFDREARAVAAASLDLRGLAARLRGGESHLAVLDLACGTGANLRELAPRLGGLQYWLLVDHDKHLLAALSGAMTAWAQARDLSVGAANGRLRISGPDWVVEVQTRCLDLAPPLDSALFERRHLITASALLDLVSAPWIDVLAARAKAAGAAMLFALNVDGGVDWRPRLAGDEDVHRLFVAHQGRDKGFGPALGGQAADHATACLAALSYDVVRAASDWYIDGGGSPCSLAMLRAMIEGAAAAALEEEPSAASWIGDWASRRLGLIGKTRLRVGHCELLATLR